MEKTLKRVCANQAPEKLLLPLVAQRQTMLTRLNDSPEPNAFFVTRDVFDLVRDRATIRFL